MKKLLFIALIGLSLMSCNKDNEKIDQDELQRQYTIQRKAGYQAGLTQLFYHARATKNYEMANIIDSLVLLPYDEVAIKKDTDDQKSK